MKKIHMGDRGKSFHANKSFEWKDDKFFEAVGTVDELISWIGLLKNEVPEFYDELERIQKVLFKLNGDLFKNERVELEEEVKFLEEKIKEYWSCCEEIKSFLIPGNSKEEALINIVRTVCRRAERRVVSYVRKVGDHEEKIKYLNRLSDYFFALGRYVNWKRGIKEKTL